MIALLFQLIKHFKLGVMGRNKMDYQERRKLRLQMERDKKAEEALKKLYAKDYDPKTGLSQEAKEAAYPDDWTE